MLPSMSTLSNSSIGTQSSSMQSNHPPYKATSTRPFHKQHVITSIPPVVTLASITSCHSTSTTLSPVDFITPSAMSPDVLLGLAHLDTDSFAPLLLPNTPMSPQPISPPSMLFDTGAFGKNPGIMRRLSRGAQHRLGRRPSYQNMKSRDQSSGPVAMRHRSDSRGLVDSPHDVSDLELDTGEEQDVAELNEKR